MPLTKEGKRELAAKFGRSETDTGSAEVQIALLTHRINELTQHLRLHKQGSPLPPRSADPGRPPPAAARLPRERKDLESYRKVIDGARPAALGAGSELDLRGAAGPAPRSRPRIGRGRRDEKEREQHMSYNHQLGETTITVEIGGEEISFTSGKLAKQADGAVVVRSGDTVVLATAVGRSEAREGADFFPLTVDIEEKMYAAGKIPGGFFKREGQASEKATLNARMVDRPIRPLWPKGFRNEVQIIGTVLSVDGEHAHDMLAINGASAALTISPLPFIGPVGAVRVGRIGGEIVREPAMTRHGGVRARPDRVRHADAITMVEAGARRSTEDVILEALDAGPRRPSRSCAQAQLELRARVGQPKWYDAGVQSRDRPSATRTASTRCSHEHGLAGIAAAESEVARGRAAAGRAATPPRTRWCAACRSPSRSR